uniref:F-box domain-containing protein n=1 Tax=Syphacia muris TaxID=451379 RepID=A0A0N5A7U7_9BILA
MCSYADHLKMRAVCKKWNNIYERFFCASTSVLRMKITAKNGQYTLLGWSESSRKLVETDANILRRIIKRTKLCKSDTVKDTGLLILEDDANNDMILDLILKQCWEIRHFEIMGVATAVSDKELYRFIRQQNRISEQCTMEDGVVEDGLISDKLLSVFDVSKLYFEVILKESCAKCSFNCGISDKSLGLIFKPNMRHMIPYPLGASITLAGIKRSLQKFFGTDWEAESIAPSYVYDKQNNRIPKKGFYSCELETHLNSNVRLYSVACLEFDGVEKRCFLEDGSQSSPKKMRRTAKRGRVYFLSRSNERCFLVKIGIV